MTETHRIEVENGEEVSAVHHKADSDRWIFFCHGFGSNKQGSYEQRSTRAVEEGFNAVRFDFRGNGNSDGDFIDQNLSSRIKDLKAVLKYFDPSKTVLFGSSFGGKVVFHTSPDIGPEAVLGRAPVTYNAVMNDYREKVDRKGKIEKIEGKPVDKSFFSDLDSYRFSKAAERIKCPVCIFHGGQDRLVRIENSWEAAKELDTDLAISKLKGETHRFSEGAEKKMMDQMFSWLKTVL